MKNKILSIILVLFCFIVVFVSCEKKENNTVDGQTSFESGDESNIDEGSNSSNQGNNDDGANHTHKWETVRKESTCKEKGSITVKCDCGEIQSEEELDYFSDHTNSPSIKENIKEASCIEDGIYDDVVYCSVCKKELSRKTETVKANHKYENGVCTVCKEKEPSQGLEFTLNSDEKSYSVSGIGTCMDTDLVIPRTYKGLPVTSIGEEAFLNCHLIKSITLPNSIKSTGMGAFQECVFLHKVFFNGTVEEWCNIEFGGYMPLCNVADLYFKDELLTHLVIPSTVTSINNYAFADCNSLVSVTIPNTVKSLGTGCFQGCYKLAEVYNFSSLDINDALYYGNCIKVTHTSLEEASILEKVNDYIFMTWEDKYYLVKYLGDETEITLPKNYKGNNYEIYQYAFCDNNDLEKVIIPDSVTAIGEFAFENCRVLTNVTIGNSVASIENGAFSNCYSLLSITIPSGVKSISKSAFSENYKLAEVYNLSSLDVSSNFSDEKVIHTSLEEKSIFETVGDYIFMTWEDKYYLMLYIGNDKELTLPENYKGNNYEIYQYAFNRNNDITKITVPKSITSIGSNAFKHNGVLTSVNISDIAAWCNISFQSELANPLNNGANLYLNGTLIEELVIPNTVEEIKNYAFFGANFTTVTIANSVKSIGKNAFSNCFNLTTITIPSSVTSFLGGAFTHSTSITSVKYLGTIEQWCNISFKSIDHSNPLNNGANLYLNGTLVEDLVIPNTVKEIKNYTFYGANIASVKISSAQTNIATNAFSKGTILVCENNKLLVKYNITENNVCQNSSHDHYSMQFVDKGQQVTLSSNPCINVPNGETFFGWFTEDGVFYEKGATISVDSNIVLYCAIGKEVSTALDLQSVVKSGTWKYARLTSDIVLSGEQIGPNNFYSAIIDLNGHTITSSDVVYGFGGTRTGMIFVGSGTINFISKKPLQGAFFTAPYHGFYADGNQKLWIGKDVKIISNAPIFGIPSQTVYTGYPNLISNVPDIRIYGEITAPKIAQINGLSHMLINIYDSAKIDVSTATDALVIDNSIITQNIDTIKIHGGNFKLPTDFVGFYPKDDKRISLFIYGGTFNIDISQYLPEGYTTIDNQDGTYTVVKSTNVSDS